MPIQTDVIIEKFPFDGASLKETVRESCKKNAKLTQPHRLIGITTVQGTACQELLLFFELADQNA